MLYVIPTPIGNLQDITLRSLDTLKKADVIFCEDTRRTHILLSHFGIVKPTCRYNENDEHSVSKCVQQLKSGKTAALVSDCGTPCISDPGWKLVKAALQNDIAVSALPGPSAVACALSAAGLTGGSFTFLGFLPRKQGKAAKLIASAAHLQHPVVIYESPYRVIKLLTLLAKTLGEQTPVILAREITKVYEEYLRGTAAEIIEILTKRPKVQGEFVVIVDCFDAQIQEEQDDDADF